MAMRWTQLRTVVEAGFADELAGRLRIHATGYGNSPWGRSWMTFDGIEFVHFSDDEAYQRRGGWGIPWVLPGDGRSPKLLAESGEFSSSEFKDACFIVKDLTVEDALATGNPLLSALACANRKVGTRTLRRLSSTSDLHPLVAHIIDLRLRAKPRYAPADVHPSGPLRSV